MRKTIIFSAFIASLSIAGFGCTGEMSGDPGDDEADVEVDGKTDSSVLPLGDYSVVGRPTDGGMIDLTLGNAKFFERHMMTYCGVANPGTSGSSGDYGLNCGDETGSFKFTGNSSGTHYIRFYDSDGNFMARVAYTYKSSTKTASFRNVDADGAKYSMKLEQPSDCRQTGCASGTTCEVCWANYACIPDGALC